MSGEMDLEDFGKLTLAERSEVIKQTITMVEVAELMGYEVTSQNKIPSLSNPDERTPSLHLYEDSYYDFSTGEWGDATDFVSRANGVSPSSASWSIFRRALKAGKEPGDVERQPVRNLVDFTDELNRHVPYSRHYWPEALGVQPPENCLQDLTDGSLLIPHERDGRVYGVKVRQQNGQKRSWPGSQFTFSLYNQHGWGAWAHDYKSCLLVEGESDCWVAQRELGEHVGVFSLPSGSGSWKDSWVSDLGPYDTIVLCFDNDEAGQKARSKIEAKLGYVRVKNLMVPQLCNDIREAVNRWSWPMSEAFHSLVRDR